MSSSRGTGIVLVDATSIPRDRGGVGRYLDGIAPALGTLGASATIVCKPSDVVHFSSTGLSVIAAPSWISSTARRLIWEQFWLPRLARRLGASRIHSPHYTFPLLTRLPHVVTVHDLTFFTQPEVHSVVKRLFFRTWIRLGALAHATIVAPSAATAAEYIRITGAPESRVFVALHGFDSSDFHRPSGDEVTLFGKELSPPATRWVAFLGTLEPRKNIVNLIKGFSNAVLGLEPAARPALLLAGGSGWDADIEPAIASALAAGLDVRTLGYLPLEQMPAFLGGAEIVAYPSLGEGFGLPVLEAMATGACVLTTRRLALPEVGGVAVAYTDVDEGAIAASISALLADPTERARLGALAQDRSTAFTWDRCARAHLAAYEGAVA